MSTKCLLLFGIATILTARDVVIREAGRVSLDFVNMESGYRNTVFLVRATYPGGKEVILGSSGCRTEKPGIGLGLPLVTDKLAAFGCRVTFDSVPSTPNQIDGFPAGTSFELGLCVDKLGQGVCDDFWSSNKDKNADGADHLVEREIHPGKYQGTLLYLGWEDTRNNGDQDFNDTVLYLRVERDTDGDGLWDDWETFGVDTNGDGEIDLDLPALGANPLHRDVFLEIDYMGKAGDGHSHKPPAEALQIVIEAFANAPVQNPDGKTGITLHIDLSNEIRHQDVLLFGEPFAGIKADATNFGKSNPRRFAFRYAIFGHQYEADNTSSGISETPGDDLMVTLPNNDAGAIAGTLMHELGHSLGLRHGGGDDVNNKPNYRSVMNYRHQFRGVPAQLQRFTGSANSSSLRAEPDELVYRYDFSRLELPTLDESALNEAAPFYPVASLPARVRVALPNRTIEERTELPALAYNCRSAVVVESITDGFGLDWNCDGNRGDRFVTADLNGGEGTVLRGHDDWANLVYSFQNNALRFGAVYREPDLVEQSPRQAAEEAAKLTYRPAASVQPIPGPVLVREVELDGSSSTVPGGGQIVGYQWRVAGLPAALNHADRPKVTVQFGGGPGEYRFDLTVTAQNGLSHTTRTTVVYAGR
jgi:hypothetical protein